MKRILSLLLACAMALGLCVVRCAANSGMADPPAETPAGKPGSFSDHSPSAGYTRAVAWCVENGLMNGVSGDAFDPDGSMTRAMLATVLYRQAGEPSITEEPEFTDVLPNAWYSDAGSTESVAEIIAEELGAGSFELVSINDYSSADLNYHSSSGRVNLEHEDESKRDVPLVSTTPDNWLDYDVVFIGYPIWWGTAGTNGGGGRLANRSAVSEQY